MKRSPLVPLLLLAALLAAGGPARAAAPEAHATRLQSLLTEALVPLLRPLAAGDSLAVELPRAKPSLADAIGDILAARGYAVAAGSGDPATRRLVVEEFAATVDFPRAHLGLLRLSGRDLLRRATVELVARVEGPGRPARVHRHLESSDWIDEEELGPLGEELPAWATVEAPKAGVPGGQRSGWWERSLVAGLLGGVAIVYFSGTQ